MFEAHQEQAAVEFRAKPQDLARNVLMALAIAGLALWIVLNGMHSGLQGAMLAAVLLIPCLVIAVFAVHRLTNPRDGELVMTVYSFGIEAERFVTQEKHFLWEEIVAVRVDHYETNRYLQLEVIETPARRDQFSVLKGVNPCAPAFPLDLLSSSDQLKLLALIRQKTGLQP